jgi:membrane protein insertase Oxa1/YidC/SpoIIIJ
MISMFNVFQLPVHLVYISMINRLAFNYEINPAILNEGMLWFTDMSSPDPTGILPVLGGIVSLLNMLTTSTTNTSTFMRKIRRYIYIFPLISIPVWMTFPVVSNQKEANHFIGVQSLLVDSIKHPTCAFKFVQV